MQQTLTALNSDGKSCQSNCEKNAVFPSEAIDLENLRIQKG